MDDSVRPGAVKDFFSAIVLLLVSGFVLQQCADIYTEAGVPMNVSPALLPLFLGCCLLLCSIILLLRTLKGQRASVLTSLIICGVKGWFKSAESEWQRVLGGVFLLGVYIFLLIPIFEFWLSTSIFLISTYLFLRATSLWKMGIITLGSVGGIILLFQQVFNVNLP